MAVNNNYSIRSYIQTDADFPKQILDDNISPPCTCIYVRGTFPNKKRLIAIVGTRKASEYGMNFARKCARELAEQDFCIVSGLAYGIDSEAHKGALDANGSTYAVLANGLEKIFPTDHTKLANEILKNNGALISEYKEGTPPLPYRFIERNRIISGLCEAIIVVEAPKKSGAMHTGFFAISQKKKLFVLTGPTSSQLYEGSHMLIRAGGRLISSIKDLLDDIGLNQKYSEKFSSSSEITDKIINIIKESQNGCSVDTIVERCTLKPQEVQIVLSELLLNEIIIENGIGRYRFIK